MSYTICLHIIPVGGEEPIHRCHESCWCLPLKDNPDDEGSLMIHHAKDGRETRERHGRNRLGEVWVTVEERIAAENQSITQP